jgi:hypothetical protein
MSARVNASPSQPQPIAEPAPGRVKLLDCGMREIRCRADDTLESLYTAAYPGEALPGGATQLGAYLISDRQRLPATGELLRLPSHDALIERAIRAEPREVKAAMDAMRRGTLSAQIRISTQKERQALADHRADGLPRGSGGATLLAAKARTRAVRDAGTAAKRHADPPLKRLHESILSHADYQPGDWAAFGMALFQGRPGRPALAPASLAGLTQESIERAVGDALARAFPRLESDALAQAQAQVLEGMRRQVGSQFFVELHRAAGAAVAALRQAVERGNQPEVLAAYVKVAVTLGPKNAAALADDLGLRGRTGLGGGHIRHALLDNPAVLRALEARVDGRVSPDALVRDFPGLVAVKAQGWGLEVASNRTPDQIALIQTVARFLFPAVRPGEVVEPLLERAAGNRTLVGGSPFLAEALQTSIGREEMHEGVAEALTWLLENTLSIHLDGMTSSEVLQTFIEESPGWLPELVDAMVA